jgi:hypothetical protein
LQHHREHALPRVLPSAALGNNLKLFRHHGIRTPKDTTMTDNKITLQERREKSSDASLLRSMIGFAAQADGAGDRCTLRCWAS